MNLTEEINREEKAVETLEECEYFTYSGECLVNDFEMCSYEDQHLCPNYSPKHKK
jgi:hypothetical protein